MAANYLERPPAALSKFGFFVELREPYSETISNVAGSQPEFMFLALKPRSRNVVEVGAALILPAGRTPLACNVAVILAFLVQDMGRAFSPSISAVSLFLGRSPISANLFGKHGGQFAHVVDCGIKPIAA